MDPEAPSIKAIALRHKAAITTACNHAAYLGEADDISVLAARNHAF